MRRWLRMPSSVYRDNVELLELLDREREMHLDNVLDVIRMTDTKALQIGNVGERVWPEALEQWLELARDKGCALLVVTGEGRVQGIYTVPA